MLGRGRWRPIKRFVKHQSGKYRCIDGGRFSGHIEASTAVDKVHTVSFDFLLAILARLYASKERFVEAAEQAGVPFGCRIGADDERAVFSPESY